MTTKNRWVPILVLIALFAGVWIVLGHKGSLNKFVVKACTEEARICPDGSSVWRSGPNCEMGQCPSMEYLWNFEEMREEGGRGPSTRVNVRIRDINYDLGSYVGSCSQIKNTSWQLLPNEIDGAICWFAGGGVELGVFLENSRLEVRKGLIEEGNVENPGTRGNFELLFGL